MTFHVDGLRDLAVIPCAVDVWRARPLALGASARAPQALFGPGIQHASAVNKALSMPEKIATMRIKPE